MRPIAKLTLACALGAMTFTSPAVAACWSPTAVNAAKVREFDTMLMVSALRCRLKGVHFMEDYNHFVRGKRPVLAKMNVIMRSHFGKGRGQRAGLNAYDKYVVTLANRYGAGKVGHNCQDMKEATHTAVKSDVSSRSLIALATEFGARPTLPGGKCSIAIASVGTKQ